MRAASSTKWQQNDPASDKDHPPVRLVPENEGDEKHCDPKQLQTPRFGKRQSVSELRDRKIGF